MKVQLEHILQNLFQKSSLEEVPVTELEEMVKEHPYFSTAHFLLAQKLKQQDAEQAELHSQKAVLYFHDPLWLQWQLKKFSNGNGVEAAPAAMHSAEIMPVLMPAENVVEEQPREWEQPHEREEEFKEQQQPVEYEELQPEEQLAVETIGPVEEAIPADPVTDEEIIEEEAALEPEVEADENNSPAETYQSFHEPEVEVRPETQEPEIQTLVHQPEPHITTDEPEAHVPAVEPELEAQPLSGQPPVPEQKASEPSKPVIQSEEKSLISFDAYYTIDYFASQGIKPPAEVQPGDKLGKQLKSFTEWLKTMKRLPQTPVEEKTDDTEQQHIREVAATSLEQKEVVTETMAEVLVKQGRNREAIAIYDKLSLLDPSKSVYFAAKIENLKAN
jgi:hypothetical protein